MGCVFQVFQLVPAGGRLDFFPVLGVDVAIRAGLVGQVDRLKVAAEQVGVVGGPGFQPRHHRNRQQPFVDRRGLG